MSNAISVKTALAQGRKIGINTLITKYNFAQSTVKSKYCLLSYPGKSDFVLCHCVNRVWGNGVSAAYVFPVVDRNNISETELQSIFGLDLGEVFIES